MFYHSVDRQVIPVDRRLSVGHFGDVLKVWTVDDLAALQRNNCLSDWGRNRMVAACDHVFTRQHLQTHSNLTARGLVPAEAQGRKKEFWFLRVLP